MDGRLTGERRRASRRTVVRVDTMVARATAAGVSRVALPAERAAEALDTLTDLVAAGGVLVLSGAGISTESGIPDYRGPSSTARRASPMTYQTFTGDPAARRRYWARSHLGWQLVGRAAPNRGHRAVAALQDAGLLSGVITQNVDGLHQAAGARDVTDLHGRLDRVRCLDCGRLSARDELHARLAAANASWHAIAARDQPGRRRRPAGQRPGRLPHGGLRRLRRRAQAGRGVLRRDRAAGPGRRAATTCWPSPAACSCWAPR